MVTLANTKQYQIDFEMYQRADNPEINFKNGAKIQFEFEGEQYYLNDLALYNDNSDFGCDFYWVEMHTYPAEQEQEEVDEKDLRWRITGWKIEDIQRLIDDPTIEDGPQGFGRATYDLDMLEEELPYDSKLPEQLLKQARQCWKELDDWSKHILVDHLHVELSN